MATDKAVIFLHGGPGYNSASFEATTAQVLADRGLYVIIYDRRGEGRSQELPAEFSFAESITDLDKLYKKYGLEKATLIGHSFGGLIATKFAAQAPAAVHALILVGAPVDFQETFRTIQSTVKKVYTENRDTVNLNYLSVLENMDSGSLQYASYTFMHAMQNNLYSTSTPTKEAKDIFSTFKTDTLLTKYASLMTYPPPLGFWNNEKYTNLDLSEDIKSLLTQGVTIRGIYGKDDGLYSAEQVKDLQQLIGANHVEYWEDCSHTVFVDRRLAFTNAVVRWAE